TRLNNEYNHAGREHRPGPTRKINRSSPASFSPKQNNSEFISKADFNAHMYLHSQPVPESNSDARRTMPKVTAMLVSATSPIGQKSSSTDDSLAPLQTLRDTMLKKTTSRDFPGHSRNRASNDIYNQRGDS